MKWIKQNKGISFLELIVVIAIVAVLGSLSIVGLVRFRQTALLKQAAREVFASTELARNKARNSSLSTSKKVNSVLEAKVDAYALVFEGDNYALYYCDKASSIGSGVDDYICNVETANLKQLIYSDISIEVDEGSSYDCQGVLFERVSGNMRLFSDIGAVRTTKNICDIVISFENTNLNQKIRFDAENNQISYIKL
ncbi:hypothetical protein JW796_00945 [Candidatus Dojkabacteria bacterium]|nr:hypothetical protein [Candidatus Dojkabacteria bacterium]